MRKQILSEEILEGVREGLPPTYPSSSLSTSELSPPLIEESYHGSLEEAANLLLSILPSSIREYAVELADITLKIPRWQLILGSLMAQNESGNLTAPSIDPAWRQIELVIQKTICGYHACKKQFTPKRFGQKYCSTKCGDLMRGEEIAKHNKEREAFREKERKLEKDAGLAI